MKKPNEKDFYRIGASILIPEQAIKYEEALNKYIDYLESQRKDWISVEDESDLPEIGKSVVICRDIGDRLRYSYTVWDNEELKYWKMNNIIAWVAIPEFKPNQDEE